MWEVDRRFTGLFLILVALILPCTISISVPTPQVTGKPTSFESNIPTVQFASLRDLYTATNGQQWDLSNADRNGAEWEVHNPTANPCLDGWIGIKCDNTKCLLGENCTVYAIELEALRLIGFLPASIGNITTLTQLKLGKNFIHGSIPETIGELYNLNLLSLEQNLFQGNLPDMFSKLDNLVRLDISYSSLIGTLPPSLYQLKAIREIDITRCNMTGTLSEDVLGWQNTLELLYLGHNNFTGSIPKNIFYLNRLSRLILANNRFHGQIICNINTTTSLTLFDVNNNNLTGTIPNGLSALTRLTDIIISFNSLTGTIPSAIFQLFPDLLRFECANNFLSGPIPSVFTSISKIVVVGVGNNMLTGPMPNFWVLKRLKALAAYHNYFTGKMQSFPSVDLRGINVNYNMLSGNLPTTQSLSLAGYGTDHNFFTGSIPNDLFIQSHVRGEYFFAILNNSNVIPYLNPDTKEEFLEALENLSEDTDVNSIIFDVVLSSNLLSGTIPTWVTNSTILTYVYLNNNTLTGTLPEIAIKTPVLSTFQIDHNRLEGSFPPSFQTITTFAYLVMNDNRFTGSIPSFLFNNRRMNELQLQNNRFTGRLPDLSGMDLSQLVDIDVSGNQLTGSISTSLFQNNNFSGLAAFAASENCFTGSIPASLCSLTYLQTLVLNGLSTAKTCRKPIFSAIPTAHSFTLTQSISGNIPVCLFQMPNLATLYLSGNGFEGRLQSDLSVNCALSTLVLSHNSLSGKIPSALQQRSWQNIDLSYNKFTGILETNAFNTILNNTDCMDRSSTSFSTAVYLDVNRLSGGIPSNLLTLRNISILNGNIFDCDNTDSSTIPRHDPKESSYDCGTDSVNRALYAWAAMFGIILAIILTWLYFNNFEWLKKARENVVTWRNELLVTSREHVEVEGGVTFLQANNPIYVYAKFLMLLRRYGAYLIALYIVTMMPLYAGLSVFQGSYERTYAWKISAAYLSGMPAGLSLMLAFMFIISTVYYLFHYQMSQQCDSSVSRYSVARGIQSMKSIMRFDSFNASNSTNSNINDTNRKDIETNIIISVLNMTLITSLNMGYITAVLVLTDTREIELVRMAVTLLKYMWNEIGIWRLLSIVKYRRMSGIISDPEELLIQSKVISSWNMFIVTFSLLFNNIIAPCLGVAIVDPNCFYNAFVAAGSVTSTYSYCGLYVRVGRQGVLCDNSVVNNNTVSYDPPFLYSYNCASLLPSNYVQIYLYMMYLSGFIQPALQLCAKYVCDHYLTEGSKTYRFVSQHCVPVLLLKLQPERVASDTTKGWDFSRKKLIDKSRTVMSIVSYVTLLVSFGAVFPPLGIVIWISMCSSTVFRTLLLGHLLYETRKLGYDWYAKQIRNELEGLPKLFVTAIYPMTFVASLLYACMVFDTIGNSNGYKVALGPALSLMLYPVLIIAAVRINWAEIKSWFHTDQDQSTSNNEPSDDNAKEEQDKGITAVQREVELSSDVKFDNCSNTLSDSFPQIEMISSPLRNSK